MVNRIFVFHGDLGAAKNILKNVVLLSPSVNFPMNVNDRLAYLLNNIYIKKSINDWFTYEYKLKDYKKFGLGVEFGDVVVDSIIEPPEKLLQLLQTKNYAVDLFNKERVHEVVNLPHVNFISVYPTTDLGVRWQVRAYTVKKKPEELHNFTYLDRDKIDQHKNVRGLESWIKVNTYNFYQNVLSHIQYLSQQNWPHVPLEWILDQTMWETLLNFLESHFQISIDHCQAKTLLQAWTDLHWHIDDTDKWEHTDIFDGFRTDFSNQCITEHSL